MRPERALRVAPPPAHCAYPKAFTLIELLVVISVVALLMAILMPCLQRARNQAKAVACRGQLRQWGVAFAMYAEDHNGRLFINGADSTGDVSDVTDPEHGEWSMLMAFHRYFDAYYKMILCPGATSFSEKAQTLVYPKFDACFYGTAHRPYQDGKLWSWRSWRRGGTFLGGYGVNGWLVDYPVHNVFAGGLAPHRSYYWEGDTSRYSSQVPVFFDCRYIGAKPVDALHVPPEFEDSPPHYGDLTLAAMNRHSGGINSLFRDWSVRKVGVKEPWTLKWHREYDTAGLWNKRGGVKPEDWPQWMRRFKDY